MTITLTNDATAYKNAVAIANELNPVDGNTEKLDEWQRNNDDVNLDEDQRDYTVHSIPNGVLKVDKSIKGQAQPGGWATYMITAKNDGPDDLTDVTVTDHGGFGQDIESIQYKNPTKGTVEKNVWKIGRLKAGEQVTIMASVKISEGTEGKTIENHVTIENPQNPREYKPGEDGQTNDNVDSDNDQWDKTEFSIPEPDVPVTPPHPEDPTAPGKPGPAPAPESPDYAKPVDVKTGGEFSEGPAMALATMFGLGGLVSAVFYGLSRRRAGKQN